MISYNFISIWTLFKKEVYRFIKVGIQTVIGPAISSLLFLAIFTLALGRTVNSINGVALAEFIAPGLIMMTMLQNSFANSASSIGQAKFQGNIVDILMAPLGDLELTIGYIGGSIARGLICGIVTTFGILLIIPLQIHSFSTLIFYSFMGCLMMGSLGTMVGIWADKWDQQQGVTNFIVLPLTFLSGTFYSISRLPEFWQNFSMANPLYWMINGLRYATLGIADTSHELSLGISIIFALVFSSLASYMFSKGYRIKT